MCYGQLFSSPKKSFTPSHNGTIYTQTIKKELIFESFGNNSQKNDAWHELSTLPTDTHLIIENSKINEADFSQLLLTPRCKILELSNCELSEAKTHIDPSILTKCINHLPSNQYITALCINTIIDAESCVLLTRIIDLHLPALEHLNIRGIALSFQEALTTIDALPNRIQTLIISDPRELNQDNDRTLEAFIAAWQQSKPLLQLRFTDYYSEALTDSDSSPEAITCRATKQQAELEACVLAYQQHCDNVAKSLPAILNPDVASLIADKACRQTDSNAGFVTNRIQRNLHRRQTFLGHDPELISPIAKDLSKVFEGAAKQHWPEPVTIGRDRQTSL